MASREAGGSGTVSEIVSKVSIDRSIVQWKRGAIGGGDGGGDGGGMGEGSIEWGRGLLEGFSSMPTSSLRVEVTVIVGEGVGCMYLDFEPVKGDRTPRDMMRQEPAITKL